MGNVLEKTKQEQVIALGRLGWSLRRIEGATGVELNTLIANGADSLSSALESIPFTSVPDVILVTSG